jgi:hypothetical protein
MTHLKTPVLHRNILIYFSSYSRACIDGGVNSRLSELHISSDCERRNIYKKLVEKSFSKEATMKGGEDRNVIQKKESIRQWMFWVTGE